MTLTKIIETESEYEAALSRVDELLDANPNPDDVEGQELRLLLVLIEKYEDEHHAIDLPDPVAAIKVRMDDLGLRPKDLIPLIGDKGTVSKVLRYKLPLSLRMIRQLSQALDLPADILVQEIALEDEAHSTSRLGQ